MADESNAFASGLLDNTRKAADQLAITVKSVDSSLASLNTSVTALSRRMSATGGGGTSQTSQSSAVGNGGSPSFTAPASGHGTAPTGGGGGTSSNGNSSGSGNGGSPTMQSRAKIIGTGAGLANNIVGGSGNDYLATDLIRNSYTGTSSEYVKSLRGQYGTMGDLASTVMTLRQSGQARAGTSYGNTALNSVSSGQFSTPGMTGGQLASLNSSVRSAGTSNRLLLSGFSAYDGSQNSMRNIANQIIQKAGLAGRKWDESEIYTAVRAENGTFVRTLNTLVENGAVPADAVPNIQDEGEQILRAQNSGMNFGAYEKGMQAMQASPDSKASKSFNKTIKPGVNTSSGNYTAKRSSQIKSQNSTANVDQFVDGLSAGTDALIQFNEWLRTVTDSKVGQVYSEGKGVMSGLGNFGALPRSGGSGGPIGTFGGGDYGGPSLASFSGAGASWGAFSEMGALSGSLGSAGSSGSLGVGGSTMSPIESSARGSAGSSSSGASSSVSGAGSSGATTGGYSGGGGGTNVLKWPTTSKRTSNKHSYPAIDIDGQMGDPIFSALAGRVASVTLLNSSYGHHIKIDHGNGVYTLYAHLGNRNGSGGSGVAVRAGQSVRQGQTIGTMGNTGHVVAGRGGDGSHLHFELSLKGNGPWGSNRGSTVQPGPYLNGSPIKQLASLATANKRGAVAGGSSSGKDSGGPAGGMSKAVSSGASADYWSAGANSSADSSMVQAISEALSGTTSAFSESIKQALGSSSFATSFGKTKGSASNKSEITFSPGSIVLSIGAGASIGQGRALATEFVNTLSTDSRIRAMQEGR